MITLNTNMRIPPCDSFLQTLVLYVQLQPLMAELKNVRHEYMEVEAQFAERKSSYDKIAVGLEIEKQTLEKDCDTFQVCQSMMYLFRPYITSPTGNCVLPFFRWLWRPRH